MKRIQLLQPTLANQIAAGEVVERPAAVLKELLENSLDADAHRIDIDIEKGGVQLIRVRDDGMGIHPDDLMLALDRHATSKIYTLHDLERITSLGFRGEALASISSVSQLTLTSCLRDQNDAWQIKSQTKFPIESWKNDAASVITPAAHPSGTTVEVHDLFFNTPARRRFLRSEQTEFGHLDDLFKRIALSHFDVAFTLRHNQKIVRQLRSATTDITRTQRAADIFGTPFMTNAIAIDNQSSHMRLWGWIALPAFSRNYTDLQYCYVNNRVVRDKLINHAIRLAYQDSLPPGRFPAFILYLEIEPSIVDVNVHPTKHEVRFHESRQIHDFLFSSIRDALMQTNVNTICRDDSHKSDLRTPLLTETDKFFVRESPAPYIVSKTPEKNYVLGHALAQLHKKYLLAENAEGLVIIDIPAARKELAIQHLQKSIASQPLLIPQSVSIKTCSEEKLEFLQKLGFDTMLTSPTTLLVRQIPSLLKNIELSTLIPELLDINDISTAIYCIAEHLSQQIPPVLSRDEMNTFLREIENTPTESKIWRQLHLSEL